MAEERTSFFLITIVAIVAIVGLVVIFMTTTTVTTAGTAEGMTLDTAMELIEGDLGPQDLTGQADWGSYCGTYRGRVMKYWSSNNRLARAYQRALEGLCYPYGY